MKIYGIFGDPIEHSLSPAMQNAAFKALEIEAYYHAFRMTKDRLKDAILGAEAMGFGGLNLTVPLKEKALEMVRPDGIAEAIGAINTIFFGQEIAGYNTDGIGAFMALQDAGIRIRGSKILLIGAGGVARAISFTLAREGAEISIANRSYRRAEKLAGCIGGIGYGLNELERLVPNAEIIINATSVGMKEGDSRFFPGELIHKGQVVFDVVYNRETELLKDASNADAVAIDGVMMLVYQGAKAFEIWTGRKAPVDVMEKAVRKGMKARDR